MGSMSCCDNIHLLFQEDRLTATVKKNTIMGILRSSPRLHIAIS